MVAPGKSMESALPREIADFDTEICRRIGGFKVPTSHRPMDWNHFGDRFRMGRGGNIGDLQESQNRTRVMPMFRQGGLGPFNAASGDLPSGLQPVRIANHQEDLVLCIAGATCGKVPQLFSIGLSHSNPALCGGRRTFLFGDLGRGRWITLQNGLGGFTWDRGRRACRGCGTLSPRSASLRFKDRRQ